MPIYTNEPIDLCQCNFSHISRNNYKMNVIKFDLRVYTIPNGVYTIPNVKCLILLVCAATN